MIEEVQRLVVWNKKGGPIYPVDIFDIYQLSIKVLQYVC